MPLAVETGSE